MKNIFSSINEIFTLSHIRFIWRQNNMCIFLNHKTWNWINIYNLNLNVPIQIYLNKKYFQLCYINKIPVTFTHVRSNWWSCLFSFSILSPQILNLIMIEIHWDVIIHYYILQATITDIFPYYTQYIFNIIIAIIYIIKFWISEISSLLRTLFPSVKPRTNILVYSSLLIAVNLFNIMAVHCNIYCWDWKKYYYLFWYV